MKSFLKTVFYFNRSKIDTFKGIRQGLLMIIPALLGYYFGFFSFGLLIATGTLAHIYVLKDRHNL